MLVKPKEILLKDGRVALLRNPNPDTDAAALIHHLWQIVSETEFLLRYPEECNWTEAQERDILAAGNADDMRLMLVCEVDGEIAGMCGMSLYPQIKFRHRASLDIGLQQRFWNLGIGTAMLAALAETARERGVMQLELEYIEGNARGRALYEKMGFTEVARHPDAVRFKDGRMRSLVFMMKKL
jgi:RimJ/RimL family protein N-acetyltransferase